MRQLPVTNLNVRWVLLHETLVRHPQLLRIAHHFYIVDALC